MKDLKKNKLDDEILKNVSGGAGEGLDMDSMQEHWNQIVNNNVPGGARDTFDPEHFQEYWNEKVSENDITNDPVFPHSKKAKGKLYK
jgi:hypothetical protein